MPLNEAEIGAAVTRVLLERMGGRPVLPQPSAPEAERWLIGGGLAGDVRALKSVQALSPLDFHDPFWQSVRCVMEGMGWERLSPAMVACVMVSAGYAQDETETALKLAAAGDGPLVIGAEGMVTRAARARRFALWIRGLEEDVCLGRVTVDGALDRMRRVMDRRGA